MGEGVMSARMFVSPAVHLIPRPSFADAACNMLFEAYNCASGSVIYNNNHDNINSSRRSKPRHATHRRVLPCDEFNGMSRLC